MGSDVAVLDASAALAYLRREPGFEVVGAAIRHGARMSAVNLAEVHTASVLRGISPDEVVARLGTIGVEIDPFEARDAAVVGLLRPMTKSLGLSLADRACLALAQRLDLRVLATDRLLAAVDVGVEVALIR